MTVQVNDTNFQAEVLESQQPVLVDFWAPWCGPCKALSSIVDEIASEYDGRLKVVKVDVGQAPNAAAKYGVSSIPNVIIINHDEVEDDAHIVLIGTGTGLAPYMSMLRTHLVCGGKRHFAVLHGARHSWDLGYRSELETLDRMCPSFSYIPCISRPQEEDVPWGSETGYIQDLWSHKPLSKAWGFHPGPKDANAFICGNPEIAEIMVTALAKEGFQEHTRERPGPVHIERYW